MLLTPLCADASIHKHSRAFSSTREHSEASPYAVPTANSPYSPNYKIPIQPIKQTEQSPSTLFSKPLAHKKPFISDESLVVHHIGSDTTTGSKIPPTQHDRENLINIIRNWAEKPPDQQHIARNQWTTNMNENLLINSSESANPINNKKSQHQQKRSSSRYSSSYVSSASSSSLPVKSTTTFQQQQLHPSRTSTFLLPIKDSVFHSNNNNNNSNNSNDQSVVNSVNKSYSSVNNVYFKNFSGNVSRNKATNSTILLSTTTADNGQRSNFSGPVELATNLTTNQATKNYNETTPIPDTALNNLFSYIYKHGNIFLIVLVSVIAVALGLVSVVRCLKATSGASGALALPNPLLPEDLTPLNAEPDYSVPMLSVQSPGCAGMERLVVPARSSLGSPHSRDRDERNRRLRIDTTATFPHHHDLKVSSRDTSDRQINRNGTLMTTSSIKPIHHNHHSHKTTHNMNCSNNSKFPHHIQLGDGEWGPDQHIQLRNACQQSEIPRTYVKAPPNKTVRDVPCTQQPYSSMHSSASSSCNFSQRGLTNDSNSVNHSLSSLSAIPSASCMQHTSSSTGNKQQEKSDKSKPFFKMFFPGSKTTKTTNNSVQVRSSSATYSYPLNNGNDLSSSSVSSSSQPTNVTSSAHEVSSRGYVGSTNSNNLTILNQQHHHQPPLSSSAPTSSLGGVTIATASAAALPSSSQQKCSKYDEDAGCCSSSGDTNKSSGAMSLSTSPSPDTSTHFM